MISLLVLAAVVSLVFLSTDRIDRYIESSLLSTIMELEEGTGLSIEYEKIFINPLGSADISEISVIEKSSERTLLHSASIGIQYNLVDILFRKDSRRDILIELGRTGITLTESSLRSLKEAADYISENFPAQSGFFTRLSCTEGVHLLLDSNGDALEAEIPELSLLYGDFRIEAVLMQEVFISYEDERGSYTLKSPMTAVYDIEQGSGTLDLPSADLFMDPVEFEDTAVSISLNDRYVSIAAAYQDIFLNASYDLESSRILADIQLEDTRVKRFLPLIPRSEELADQVNENTRISTNMGISYSFEERGLFYEGDLEIEGLYLGERAEELSLAFEISGDLDSANIEGLQTSLGDYSITGGLLVNMSETPEIEAELQVADIQNDQDILQASIQHTQEGTSIQARSPQLEDAAIEARLRYPGGQMIEMEGEVYYEDDVYALNARYDITREHIEADMDSQVFLQAWLNDDDADISLTLDSYPIRYEDETIAAVTAEASGNIAAIDDWEIFIASAEIGGLEYQDQEVQLRFNAEADPKRMVIGSLLLDDSFETLQGAGLLEYTFPRLLEQGLYLQLQLAGEDELYTLQASYGKTGFEASVDFKEAQTSRLRLENVRGTASGNAMLKSIDDSLSIEAYISADDLYAADSPVEGDLNITIDDENAYLQSEGLRFGDIEVSEIAGTVSAKDRYASASFRTSMQIDQKDISFSSTIDMPFPSSKITELRVAQWKETGFELDYIIHDIVTQETPLDAMTGSITYEDERFSVTRTEDEDFLLTYDMKDGGFTAAFDSEPLSFTADGTFRKGVLSANSGDLRFSADLINELDIGILDIRSGEAEGSIFVTGTLTDLEYFGEVFVHSITLESKFTKEEIYCDDAYISLAGKEIIFAPFYLRDSQTTAETELSFFIEDIAPTSFDFKLKIPRDQPIGFVQEFGGMRLKYSGMVSGEIDISGFFDEIRISGDAYLDSGEISMIDRVESQQHRVSTIALSLTTGRNLQFVFPNTDIPIIRAFAKDGEKITISANLTKDEYRANGNIGLRGGEIVYFQRNFYIIDGELELTISQNLVDPRISATARIKDFDKNGNKVDIYLSLDKASLENLSPSFSSIPAKTLAEISDILGGNILPSVSSGTTDISSALAVATLATDVIQQVGLISIDPISELEKSVRNALNFDLFSIRTQVIQNILLDTIPGEVQSSFISNPIARYLDNTTVFLGKYITDDMFLQAIIQLTVNDDYTTGLFITDDIGLDLELSYEWENPLYYLTISMQPESFAFSDIVQSLSIGVSWNLTF